MYFFAVVAEALSNDMELLESGLQEGKVLVPKAIDADDEDNPGPTDDESDDDDEVSAHIFGDGL